MSPRGCSARGPPTPTVTTTVTDAVEVSLGPDPRRIDSDGDGLTDAVEARAGGASTSTRAPPSAPRQPGDRRRPGWVTDDFERLSGTDAQVDSDADRLPDAVEAALGTNPRLSDTDLDGYRTAPRSTTARTLGGRVRLLADDRWAGRRGAGPGGPRRYSARLYLPAG